MSQAKRVLEEFEEAKVVALDACISAGMVKVCSSHEEAYVVGDRNDTGFVYAIATNKFKAGAFGGDRETLMDATKSVIDDLPDACTLCTHRYDKDD